MLAGIERCILIMWSLSLTLAAQKNYVAFDGGTRVGAGQTELCLAFLQCDT